MPRTYRGSNSAVSKRLMEKDRAEKSHTRTTVKEKVEETEEAVTEDENPADETPKAENREFKFTPKSDGESEGE